LAQRVVVGVDGSPAAAVALTWAVEEARLRGAELVAWRVLDGAGNEPTPSAAVAQLSPSALAELTGGYPVTLRRGHGDPATELVAACADADLLVVGSRGRSRLAGLLLGSVSRACLAHAPCPVVVVALSHRRVIVGVDGSEHSRQALRLAAEEARLRDAALNVVHAVFWEKIGMELLTPTREQLVKWGRKLVATELAATGVAGRTVVVHGRAPEVLVRHSTHADLLVLGSRGRNPVVSMLGSTSEHCARHAHCPVMITHCQEPTAGKDAQALPRGTTR
jgi:nucleotide-binding universal stress UspA family protein